MFTSGVLPLVCQSCQGLLMGSLSLCEDKKMLPFQPVNCWCLWIFLWNIVISAFIFLILMSVFAFYFILRYNIHTIRASQVVLVVKNPPANIGDMRDVASILGSGRSPWGGLATLSSMLAWRIQWTEEPGRLQSMGFQRMGRNWSDLACVHMCIYTIKCTNLKYSLPG